MYRSIYPYENKDPSFVAFETGDVFNLIEQIDGHWWSVHDEKGNHGLVPATYLEVNNISEAEVLRSIDKSIESLSKKHSVKGRGALNEEERRILQKLIKNRQMVAAGNSLWSKTTNGSKSPTGSIPEQPKRQAPRAPGSSNVKKGKSTKRYSAPAPPVGGDLLSRSKSLNVNSPTDLRSSQSFDEGASSKIYNIVVNNGNTQLPLNTIVTTGNNKTCRTDNSSITTAESSTSSGNSSKDSSPSSDCQRNPGLKEVRGKNLTISRSNDSDNTIVCGLQATNFTVSKSNSENKKDRLRTQSLCTKKTSRTVEKIPVQGNTNTTLQNTTPANRSGDTHRSCDSVNRSGDAVKNLPIKRSSSSINTTNKTQYDSDNSLSSTSLNSFSSSTLSVHSAPNLLRTSALTKNMNVPENLGKDLVDIVRSRCKLSFNKSLAAVRVVLHTLGGEVPEVKVVTDKIREQIVDNNLHVHRGSLAVEDTTRLQDILERLTEHKQDSQQRNWAVHEDFQIIKDLLDDLIRTLGEIDPGICRSVLQEDEYRYINDLVIYYQMEHRSQLRVTLLHVFGCFCELGAEFVTQLLCSVLPTELALDIMQDQKDILKLLTSSLMLTMVFSTGESVPYNHYVQFNEAFVNFVLDTIEDPPDGDDEDQVSDALVGVLLAFNQHIKTPKVNVVLHCIAKRRIFRTLSEKILLLVNRERDPVAIFDFAKSCPDSVMKFLIDLFASKSTSGIFFTNDLMVLIDIILRQITDRPVKDKTRTEYLSLFHSLLNTTNYAEHRHLAAEFKRCFQDILMNKELESEVDLYIVREITNRFGDLFEGICG